MVAASVAAVTVDSGISKVANEWNSEEEMKKRKERERSARKKGSIGGGRSGDHRNRQSLALCRFTSSLAGRQAHVPYVG